MQSITVTTEQETPQTVGVTIQGPDLGSGPILIGHLEITAVPKGARITGWHGGNDMQVDDQIVLHGETP